MDPFQPLVQSSYCSLGLPCPSSHDSIQSNHSLRTVRLVESILIFRQITVILLRPYLTHFQFVSLGLDLWESMV